MLFENLERKIISQVFNADPKLIPMITRIYHHDAKLNREQFKDYSITLGVFSLCAVVFYHHHDFDRWPLLSCILIFFIGVQIFGSMVMLAFMLIDYMKGNIKLKIFNKILKAYEANLTTFTKENTNERK